MHPLISLRRLAVGAALAGAAIGAAPSLASAASPCSYDPITRIATITDATDSFHQLRIGTSGGLLTVDSTGHCISSTSDVATVTNTDTIFVTARANGASDGVVLDESQGAFAPGASSETDQVPEIEIGIVGQSGHLTIVGTPGFDALRIGGNHIANLNTDDDDDVTFTAGDVSLVGGNGGDFLTGLGYGSHPATTLPMVESGGAGEDLLQGGLGADHLAGNAGNDTLVSVDGVQDFVSGGADFDVAKSDGGDILSGIESPAGIARVAK
jgi:Ca2+-binding RTX toxin-like protein